MTGEELRKHIERLGWPITVAAPRLGLSLSGLHHQLSGVRDVSRQTEIIVRLLELVPAGAVITAASEKDAASVRGGFSR